MVVSILKTAFTWRPKVCQGCRRTPASADQSHPSSAAAVPLLDPRQLAGRRHLAARRAHGSFHACGTHHARVSGLGASGTHFGNMLRRYLDCETKGWMNLKVTTNSWRVVILCVSGLCRLDCRARCRNSSGFQLITVIDVEPCEPSCPAQRSHLDACDFKTLFALCAARS